MIETKKTEQEYLAQAQAMLPEAMAEVEKGNAMLAEARAAKEEIDGQLRDLMARRDANDALIAEIEASMPGLEEEVVYLQRQIAEISQGLGIAA